MPVKFSIIMPSRLEWYQNAAQDREQKLIRAVNGIIGQTFPDWELLIIADGCEKTKEIIKTSYTDDRIRLNECTHKALFHNMPRNTGIRLADGEYIIYCDIDDWWGDRHLEIVVRNLADNKWVWYNDIVFDKDKWIERSCNIKKIGYCGTSNICHRRDLNLLWTRGGYAHDYYFIKELLTYRPSVKIETPEYYVMHIPGKYDL